MLRQLSKAAFGVLALATALPAFAQQGSPTCVSLERQLAALASQGASQGAGQERARQIETAFQRQRADLDRTTAQARGMGCGGRFLFGPPPPPQCQGLENRIRQGQANLDRLNYELRRLRSGGSEAQRQQIIAALGQNQCGPQYARAAPPPPPQRGGGLFGLLFGNRGPVYNPQEAPPPPSEAPTSSTYRTVCVRTCDGFFFPVSYTTVPARFGHDDDVCRRTCPGTEALLFSYPNPGSSIVDAISTTGTRYGDLENAFRYQKEFVKGCSCKPANMSWAEALAGSDDVERGDIVVDEARSRAMSQPQGEDGVRSATPAEAARAAQQAGQASATEGVQEVVPEENYQPNAIEAQPIDPVPYPPR